mmetsp:Transcript_44803/g.93835  ORF Transcript_44803/g.93835 Transcript_44803/m.93835 type:complete len:82 (-) Transcript_44803:175-420(-)
MGREDVQDRVVIEGSCWCVPEWVSVSSTLGQELGHRRNALSFLSRPRIARMLSIPFCLFSCSTGIESLVSDVDAQCPPKIC